MTSFAVAFLFISQLIVALAMIWLWWRVKDRMAALEAKAAEALDDQDLMEYQERIVGLLGQVKEAGNEVVALIDERRAGLDREGARARDAEKRLAEKIKTFERVEEKARKKLDDWVAGQSKKASPKAKKAKKTVQIPLAVPATDLAESSVKPDLKVSYLKRDFRPPEPQAPVLPTGSRYLKVYELADKGATRDEIAKACGYLAGEVELILNLRPRPRG